jgi:NOL1/NOP2/fmu family ribosome biogenesis protein
MGKRKIYAYTECTNLNLQTVHIIHYGVYFGRFEKDGLRLSIEGSQLIGEKAKRNIVEVDHENAVKWMRGEDIKVETEACGYVILKWKNYYLGCGKIRNGKIINFVPKDRRVKTQDTTQTNVYSE